MSDAQTISGHSNASPDISVVLATYNRRASLPRTIESVMAQQGVSCELIIVDDCSSDDTAAYLRNVRNPQVRIIRASSNLGPGGARNLGIDAARAPIIAFVDSDDVYLPDRLVSPYTVLNENPELVCSLSSSLRVFPNKQRMSILPDVTLAPAAFLWTLLCELIGSETSGITVRRDAALAVGGFRSDLRCTEDREFLARLAARGGSARLLAAVHWEKSWSADGLSDTADAAPALLALLEEHGAFFQMAPKLASYHATRILVRDLRASQWTRFGEHLRHFRRLGILEDDLRSLIRDYREVSRYRRQHLGSAGIATLTRAPADWT